MLVPAAQAGTVPSGFQDSVALTGFTNPTAVRFAADGRVFVAEKSGIIKVFDDLNDPTPTTFANLNVNVYNFWDRGLLGMALAPNFPADPWVYVLYTYDAAIGGVAPRWGTPGVLSDGCPTPPGPTTDGCVVSGRVSRLQAAGNVMTGSEQVLIEDWCQQFPSHSVGSLEFGADGALYVSGGDGASFTFTDWGQTGIPKNPCGDPPGSPGSTLTPPTAEGGALRSQDLRTPADPVALNGTIARIDPTTGAGKPDNPLWSSSDLNARRIIAYGSRNPFRFTIRPGTTEVWSGDVGYSTWEEINRLGSPIDPVVDNFGWPCYEGPGRESGYDGANLNICENLYSQGAGAVVSPYFTYNHGDKVVPGESCPTGSSSISGLAFYNGGNYPDHGGALFFADYSRNCIWVMKAGTNGLPDTNRISTFDAGAAGPVDIEIGPGGDLFYAAFDEGTIRRIRYFAGNQPPTAVATANPQSGPVPLTVNFDGRGSSDPESGALTYSWDLDGNGTFGDSTSATPQFTYPVTQTVTVQLRVTDPQGATATDAIVVNAGNNSPPTPVISTPSSTTTWKVGDLISFSGSATDPQDGTIPASRLSWELVMNHCPSNCHTHPIQSFVGVASGSFNAPDHEYPSHLELRLTATDSAGASVTTSVRLNPRTVDLTFLSSPSGVDLAVNGAAATAPFTRTVIQGSANTVSAITPQTVGGNGYTFTTWSDGGAQTHSIVAGATSSFYTANYDVSVPGPVAAYGFEEPSGSGVNDSSGSGNNGTLTSATRTTAGKFGSALTFNGSSSWVTIPDAPSLDLTNSMTLEAWVKPATLTGAWRTVLMKEQSGDVVYDLYAHRISAPQAPLAEVAVAGGAQGAQSTSTLPLNVWSHLAATYDGSIVRLYVNGTQVATQLAVGDMPNSTGPLRIGGNGIWSEWFDGQIDEVRVYGRVLTPAEVQADMNKAVVNPDAGPPTAPSGLAANGGLSTVSLSWNPSTDDVGVVRYNVHRSTTQGFAPSAANRVGQPTGTSFSDTGLAAGTYYYRVTAEDAAGNISAASGEASAIVTGDTQAPTAPSGLSALGSLSSVALAWSGSTDNVGVVRYNVHRSTTQGFTPNVANRVGQPTTTSFTDTGLAAGTYYYRVTAEDAAGNVSAASGEASAVVTGDTTPPTAPATLTATPGSLSAQLSWSAASDNVGVVRYNVHRSTTNGFTPSAANRIAQPTGTSYTDGGLAAGTYYYRVTAEDAAGNVGPASPQASAVVTNAPAGLVAAYSFDEGSGTVLGDTSGRGNNGSIANATWATVGKYGKALQFNGTNAMVSVPDSATLDLTTGMTLEAWVNPTQLGGTWRTVLMKETTNNVVYDLYGHGGSGTKTPMAESSVGGAVREARAPSALALNTWTHLASTYDGTTLRLYVNGTQVATLAIAGSIAVSTGQLRIGGNSIWNEWFEGMIDEVRVYNRALTAAEIQADLATSVGNQDSTPPTTPTGLTPTVGLNSVALSWNASTDAVGVVRYNVHRSTTAGFTPSVANRIAQPPGTSFTDSPLSPATYYYRVTAEDAAGNISAPSAEASAVVTGDISPPTQPSNLSATGSLSSVALTWTASGDNVGVVRYNVHRSTTQGFTPSAANRIGQPTGTSLTDSPLTAGTYYYRVTAEDAAGNLSIPSAEASAVVTGDVSPPTAPSNLSAIGSVSSVALAWSGSTDNVAVVRYNLHRSTTPGFTPSVANRIGQPTATSFTDSPLTAGTYYYRVTAEDAAGNVSAASGEQSAVVTGDVSAPSAPANVVATGSLSSVALSWSPSSDNVGVVRYNVHRSTTNGFTPSAANRIAQPTATSYTDSPLSPGTYYYRVTAEDAAGNVSAASAQATAVVTGDVTAPSQPTGFTATPGATSAALAWAASTDNVGVVRYNVHRSTTNGFTPSAANRIAQPTGTSYTDSPLSPGTYYYRVTAEDAAGNVSAASAQATAVVTAALPGLVAAYSFDEGSGHDGGRLVRQRQQRDGCERDLVDGGQVRQGAPVQRLEHMGDGPRLGQPRPDERHDPRGVGAAGRSHELAHGRLQGAGRQPRLRALREHERPAAECAGLRRGRRPERERHRAGRGERLDAPGRDVRRREPPDLRERNPGGDDRADRRDHDVDRGAQDRREQHLARVVPGPHRRGARLQPGAQRDGDPGRHGGEHLDA